MLLSNFDASSLFSVTFPSWRVRTVGAFTSARLYLLGLARCACGGVLAVVAGSSFMLGQVLLDLLTVMRKSQGRRF